MTEYIKEESPANCAGEGKVAGIGVGPQGEPGVKRKKKKGDANIVLAQMITRKIKK